jgi:hypothetical protein
MTEPIPCEIEHLLDFDEATGVLIRSEGDLGVIEIRGLENIVLLRFNRDEWLNLYNEVFLVDSELCVE